MKARRLSVALMLCIVSILLLCGTPLDAKERSTHQWKRVSSLPEGKQTSFGRDLLPGRPDSSLVMAIVEAPYEKTWKATVAVAKEFAKIGRRSVVSVDEELGRIQNGKIDINAAFGSTSGAWFDEFFAEITAEGESRTLVAVRRRVVQKKYLGEQPWETLPSNGKIECWIITRIGEIAEEMASTGDSEEEEAAESVTGEADREADILTNSDILKLVAAGLPDSVILAKIRGSTARFNTDADSLIQLKEAGVSDSVLEAMIDAETAN